MKRTSRFAAVPLFALSLGVPLPSRAQAAELKPVSVVEGISEYALGNGLRVLLFPDSSKPMVTINVTYFVGSRHEGYGESGMAHLLEHLMFKGTTRHAKIWSELDSHGARFNGTTSYDRTNYFETLQASDENLRWALDMEADRMVNSRIAKNDLASEFSVVRNEFEIGENAPQHVLEERLLSTAYLWHNYGKSTIGSRADIERVPIESLQAFYHHYYRPDNAMLVVAGNIDPIKTLGLVEQYFGKVPRGTTKLSPTYTVEPVQDGERTVTVRRTGDVGAVGVVYHGLAGADPDFVAEEALVDMLTHKPTGRLYKALVDKGLASQVEGEAFATAEPGVAFFMAEVPKGKSVDSVRSKMISTIEQAASKLTDDDLARFKAAAVKEIDLQLTDAGRVGVELSEWAAQGDWRLLFVHRDAIKALDLARVKKLADSYLKESNRTVGTFQPTKSPERAPLPGQPQVAALVSSYKGAKQAAQGEAFTATVANIEKRTERVTLPVGMKLALLPKKTRGEAVKLLLRINTGSEKDLKGHTAAAGLLPELLLRGTKKRSYQQLRDALDGLRAELRVNPMPSMASSRPGEAIFTVTTVRASVPEVIGLLAEMVRQPSFTRSEFDKLKLEQQSKIEAGLQQPQPLAFSTLAANAAPWPKDDVRHRATLKEELAELKEVRLDELRTLHRQLWGAGDATLTVVGDFDAAQVKTLADKEFGGWKAKKPYQRIANPYKPALVGDELIATPDKQMAAVGIASPLQVRDDDPDAPALQLANFVYGGGVKSRLFERLRQKEGWSYAAHSMFDTDSYDQNALFMAFAFCAPDNAGKALKAILEELGTLSQKGVSDGELKEAKHAFRELWDAQLASDERVAFLLDRTLNTNRSLTFWEKQHQAVDAVDAKQVSAVLAKYVKPEALVKVKAGDLKK